MELRWLTVISAVLATVLLLVHVGHGAVIKRENSITEQELVAEELLATAKQSAAITERKDNEAIEETNRISDAVGKEAEASAAGSKLSETAALQDETDIGVTGEPFDADEGEKVTDTPIPTFQPSINRYTSAYRDDGVAESESLRESMSGGGVYTTVDYEQRFDRLEMTTVANIESAENNPQGMFKQESHRFDAKDVELEEESQTNAADNQEQATVINLATANSDNLTNLLETTKYETQAEPEEAKPNQTSHNSQKRGKFLQNPEEATIINAEISDSDLSIPSTADVWALAAMRNVDHGVKTRVDRVDVRPPIKDTANATSATKLLTDWMGIVKNDGYSNGSFLGNDIPRPEEGTHAPDNKLIPVAAATPPSRRQSTTSIRRFDEGIDMETTTEENIDRSIDLNYPSGIGATGVSDNLYYEDFTTDLPEYLTTTPTVEVDGTMLPESNQKIQSGVMTATTEAVPRTDINTVPSKTTFDIKTTTTTTTEASINDPVSPLESSSLSENIIPITTEEMAEGIANSGVVQNPTTPAEMAAPVTVSEEPPIRIIPLVDREVEQQHKPHEVEAGEADEAKTKNQNIVESTASPTEITNNSIEKQTASKVGESNNLPEYTVVVQPTGASGSGGDVHDVDATANNNSNYLETTTNNNSNRSSQSSAPHNDHEDGQQQLAHTESISGVLMPVSETNAAATAAVSTPPPAAEVSTESGAAVSASEATTMTTTAAPMTTVQKTTTISYSPTTDPPALTPVVSETMVSETKTTPVTTTPTTTTSTISPERIELETRRTNGHQMIDGNKTLDLAAVGAAGEATTSPEDGSDVNGIIAITVSVIAVIALVLLVGFLYVMRKRQKQMSYGQRCQPVGLDAYSLDNVSVYNSVRRKNNNLRLSKRSYGNSAFEDPGLKFNNLSIQGLQVMMGNKMEIYEEFKEIPSINARVDEVPPGCEDKNRYANVVPLPETRVHLKQLNGDEKTEYINANYVRGPKDNTNYYIACQAPMENTIVDFWRMIWEQNSKVICMLTDLTENGIEKCAEYLPPSAVLDTNRVFGDYSVTLKNREVKDKYAVSTIHLGNSETNTWREITHFWYQWPEEGMPLDETSVIAMLLEVRSYLKMNLPEQTGTAEDETTASQDEKLKKIQELNDDLTEKLDEDGGEKKANPNADKSKSLQRTQGPLTVHCSPGTGRTGTIIACDIALRSLEMKNRSVDVPQIVYYVRRGRASTIKTRDQYEFVYRCANTYAQKLMEPIVEN